VTQTPGIHIKCSPDAHSVVAGGKCVNIIAAVKEAKTWRNMNRCMIWSLLGPHIQGPVFECIFTRRNRMQQMPENARGEPDLKGLPEKSLSTKKGAKVVFP
jgi:hypothetical protein